MYVRVCLCAFVHAHMCECVYVCVRECKERVRVCVCTCMHAYVHACMHLCVKYKHIYIYIYISLSLCKVVHNCIHSSFSLPPPPAWTGPLAPNEKLTQAERVFENQLKGPESVVRDGGIQQA